MSDSEGKTVAVTGASGLVGSHLAPFLRGAGWRVLRMVRRPTSAPDEARWDPETGYVNTEALTGARAVIHLAGESVAARWTDARKRRIRDSRVRGTETLARALANMETPPSVLVSASGIDYYGDRGDERLDEHAAPGDGFLAEVCQAWEAAATPARDSGIRVVHPRIGMVLARGGGALGAMLPPFKLGLGGPIGGGRQFMSWIALDDLAHLLRYLLDHPDLSGPVNAVSPNPATNRDFTATLGRVLKRPALVPLPSLAVSSLFGEMGRTMLLQGRRAEPARLSQASFQFRHPELEGALRHELGL